MPIGTSPAHAPQGDVQCREMAVKARAASRQLQALRSEDRVAILNRIADSLESHEQEIMAENAVDVEAASGKVGDALLQRLVLKPTNALPDSSIIGINSPWAIPDCVMYSLLSGS